jgi:hypothetical protein
LLAVAVTVCAFEMVEVFGPDTCVQTYELMVELFADDVDASNVAEFAGKVIV